MMNKKTGILLSNLGSPAAPTPEAVAPYLRQFLSDPLVIDIPAIPRWILVNCLIVPRRSKESAEAYQKVWTSEGSPLVHHTRELTKKVRQALADGGQDIPVEFGMRYGAPSIFDGLKRLQESCDEVLVAPLYPQYAGASTQSTIHCAQEALEKLSMKGTFLPAFYAAPAYIESFAKRYEESIQDFDPDYVLFSYHGLPERQILRLYSSCEFSDSCCTEITDANANCYRAQCFATTRLIATRLGLVPGTFGNSFQSRLGRTKWIDPYTDVVLKDLAKKGKKRVLVFSPAFVADCLETLEEIRIRGQEDFVEAGGEELRLVSSLNSKEDWVAGLTDILLRELTPYRV